MSSKIEDLAIAVIDNLKPWKNINKVSTNYKESQKLIKELKTLKIDVRTREGRTRAYEALSTYFFKVLGFYTTSIEDDEHILVYPLMQLAKVSGVAFPVLGMTYTYHLNSIRKLSENFVHLFKTVDNPAYVITNLFNNQSMADQLLKDTGMFSPLMEYLIVSPFTAPINLHLSTEISSGMLVKDVWRMVWKMVKLISSAMNLVYSTSSIDDTTIRQLAINLEDVTATIKSFDIILTLFFISYFVIYFGYIAYAIRTRYRKKHKISRFGRCKFYSRRHCSKHRSKHRNKYRSKVGLKK